MTIFTRFSRLVAAVALVTLTTTGMAQTAFQKVGTPQLRFNRVGSSRQFSQAPQGFVAPVAKKFSPAKPYFKEEAQQPNLIGSVIYAIDLESRPQGMYKIDLTDSAWDLLSATVNTSQGGVLAGNTYVASWQEFDGTFISDYIAGYDPTTWQEKWKYTSTPFMQAPGDMAADPQTGDIYGCFWNDSGTGYMFGRLDIDELDCTPICDLYACWIGCAFDSDGTLYCVDADGVLNKVNKYTGELTTVGNTRISSAYPSSAVIDPATHTMYCTAAPMDGRGLLYQVNLKNGRAQLLSEFPYNEEITGLAILTEADNAAPGQIGALETVFNGGSLTGTLRFTAPSTMADGAAGVGALEYVVSVDGVEALTGNMIWGEKKEVELTVTEAGMHVISVAARCGEHKGMSRENRFYIGNDTPKMPEVTLTRQGNNNVISWTLPATGVNEGYVNAAATTYTVTRINGTTNTVVAQDITATSFTDPVEETTDMLTYTYKVTATFAGLTSQPALTNPLYLGYIVPPYLQTFDNAESLAGFTIIDNNEDGMIWKWLNEGCVRMNYRNAYYMDDYLVTPRIQLEGGKAYRLSFDVDSHKPGYVERIEVLFGNQPTVEGLTTMLVQPTEVPYTTEFQTINCVITPETSGDYYVGFHGISDPAQYYLKLDNIRISEALPTTLPAAATNLTVTPDYGGALTAHIQFDVPTVDLAGNALSELTRIEVMRGTELIKTIDNPTGTCEFDDNTIATAGRYSYTVTGYNAQGAGMSTSARAYVGINKPMPISNLKAVEVEDGVVELTWDAPATDVDNQPMNPALLTYTIAEVGNGDPVIMEEDITDTHCTIATGIDDMQIFQSYAVFAVTEGGMADGLATPLIPVGPAEKTPFSESFAGGLAYPLAIVWKDPAHKGTWTLLTDSDIDEIKSADGDGGFMGMSGQLDCQSTIWTVKISLADLTDPMLSFQTFNMNLDGTPDLNYFNIEVECEGKTETLAENLVIDEIGANPMAWGTIEQSLKKYVGKTIRLGITAMTKMYVWTFLDDLRIYQGDGSGIEGVKIDAAHKQPLYYDLTGRRIEAPRHGVTITSEGKKMIK